MPSLRQHLKKAENNKQFAALAVQVSSPCSVEWALVSMFYSALHFVEAFHARYNHHCATHQDRNREVDVNPQLQGISFEYRELYDWSLNSRYRPVGYGPTEIQQATESLAAIENHIRQRLG